MPRTRAEIEAEMLAGRPVGPVALRTPAEHRMFRFLLASPERGTGPFTEDYVAALKAVYAGEDEPSRSLPLPPASPRLADDAWSCWRLTRIEAEGFGGVNAHGGRPFVLDLDGDSLCVEGYNGQGKTSLASVITVALTGQRISRDGPGSAACQPAPVRQAGKEGGTDKWPPAVAYPRRYQDSRFDGGAGGRTADLQRRRGRDASRRDGDHRGRSRSVGAAAATRRSR